MDATTATTHPGRWLGGLAGGLVALGVSGIGLILGTDTETGFVFLSDGGLVELGILGVPIGFLVGRALLPAARADGIGWALFVGLWFGIVAPPLGAIEIVFGTLWPGANPTGFGDTVVGLVVLLPIAMAYSFVAAVVTLPAGIAWAVLVRAIPATAFRTFEMPRPVASLGARHAIALGLLVVVAASLVPSVVDAIAANATD
jgi:hypothetical protein